VVGIARKLRIIVYPPPSAAIANKQPMTLARPRFEADTITNDHCCQYPAEAAEIRGTQSRRFRCSDGVSHEESPSMWSVKGVVTGHAGDHCDV
jgi:hypothetical protein